MLAGEHPTLTAPGGGPVPHAAGGRSGRLADAARQLAIGLLIWAGYLLITHGVRVDLPAATGRGRQLLRFERVMHLDLERATNHWLSREPVLGWLASWEYATTYIVTTFGVLGWLWWRHRPSYDWARNLLIHSTTLALLCFWSLPTAPPRLLGGTGIVDIVSRNHPVLSWGGGAVASSADQYAAMPSLHVGWAVWVTVVTIRAGASRLGYWLAGLHLAVTVLVVVATGNHYLLDVLGGGIIVAVAAGVEWGRAMIGRRGDGSGRVRAADEFFLQVESETVQQPVGGFVFLDLSQGPVDLAAIRAVLQRRIERMPRFQQRLLPATRWRHARWQTVPVDLDAHLGEHRLPDGGGRAALAEFVSRLAEQRLDRDRPLWQLWFVPDVGPNEAAAIAIMHHVLADGLGVVDILRQLFEPTLPDPDLSGLREPSRLARIAFSTWGIGQLAVDGGADRLPFVAPLSGRRTYRYAMTPLPPVLDLARRTGTRVTDVLLAATGEALAQRECAAVPGQSLRAAVPVSTRIPAPEGTGRLAEPGNLTSALRLDVDLSPMSALERLRKVHRAAAGRRRSVRAFGAAAVIQLLGLLPPALHSLAARGVYRGRHFTAIVSNMPGPSVPMSLAGAPIQDVYPIIPLAEAVPLGVGSLGWAGQFCVSVTADSERLPEAGSLADRIVTAIERMQAEAAIEPARAQS